MNEITIFDPQPMPNLEDINKLGKAKYLRKLDLTNGFGKFYFLHSLKQKSAFVTPFGHFHFTVMPFRMVNSSATLVRMMKMVLPKLEDFSDTFIDDVIILVSHGMNTYFRYDLCRNF